MKTELTPFENEVLKKVKVIKLAELKAQRKSKKLNLANAAQYAQVNSRTLKCWLKKYKVPHCKYPYQFRVRQVYLDLYKELLECEC